MTIRQASSSCEPLEAVLARLEGACGDSPSAEIGASTPSSKGPSNASNRLPEYDDPDTSMLPILVAICLIEHNEPSDFAVLFRYFADSSKHSSAVRLSKLVLRLRTALFKAVPLVGAPRIINALSALQNAVQQHPKGEEIMRDLPSSSRKPTKTTEEDSAAGWAFFKAIYAQHAEKIIERIGTTSPDLAEMIIDGLYGTNLSRAEVLSWKETVLIEFTGCASLGCPAQAKGHFFGCKNLGVSRQSIEQAIEVLREIGNWVGQPLQEENMSFLSGLNKFP